MPSRASARAVAGVGIALLLTVLRVTPRLEAQPGRRRARPSLDDVLARAGSYAVDYGLALTSVLAEEPYTQRLVWRNSKTVLSDRRLRSEIAFVRLVDSTEWLAFRNVLAVERRRRFPESDGRLERLFRGSQQLAARTARLIAGDSARFNLGPITREINVPTTALHFVHPRHRPNCRFDKEGEEASPGSAHGSCASESVTAVG